MNMNSTTSQTLKIKRLTTQLAIITGLCLLLGCGGGGGGSDSPPPTITPTPPPTPTPSSVSLSGTLTPAATIEYDSDVNDPFASYADNDDFPEAQEINNLISLHGFASAIGMGTFGYTGRFANSVDLDDVFRVSLQAGQQIQLQVVDYLNFDLDITGDLDLYLWDESTNLVDGSFGVTEFENITVATSGIYYINVTAAAGASKYVLRLLPPSINNTAQSTNMDFIPGEMIVQFAENTITEMTNANGTETRLSLNHQNTDRPTLAKIQSPKIANTYSAAQKISSLQQNEKYKTLRAIKAVGQQANVKYAEPNYIVRTLAIPNDELYNYQWHYPLINLPQAWDITTGTSAGNPVIVAVIDTGLFLDHPDFQNQLVPGYDFISNAQVARDGNGIDSNPDDPGDSPDRGKSSWHGSHVAGTIAARTNDGAGISTGVAGVSWGAKIMPLRALGDGGGSSYDIAQAIRFAARLTNDSGTLPAQRADIINMSLGGPGFSQASQDVITSARNAGVIVIAAAGNNNVGTPFYPASYNGVVSVSAVDLNRTKAPYSNFGDTIDVAAPGGNTSADNNGDGFADGVLSASVDDTSGVRVRGWKFYQGTSMASPHVAGVVALMKAVYPALTPTEFDNLLQNGDLTEDIGDPNFFGNGLIDAFKAVSAAQDLAGGMAPPPPAPQIVASPRNISFGLTSQTTLSVTNEGGGVATLTDISSDATWLSITPDAIDVNNFGTYDIEVDRTGLGDGSYQTTIVIEIDGVNSLTLLATMQIGLVSGEGKIHQQYVLLLDAATQDVVDQTSGVLQGGNIIYQFNNIPEGEYQIYSGSDIDNDNFICQSGESCGAYPSLNERQIVTVDSSNISNLDIVVEILGTISNSNSNSSTSPTTPIKPTGIYRVPSKNVENNSNVKK